MICVNLAHDSIRCFPWLVGICASIGLQSRPRAERAPCREDLRQVTVWDERNQCEVRLLTNQLKFAATTIAAIYRRSWQIELFFKALKQTT